MEYSYNKNNIHIKNSYIMRNKENMHEYLEAIRKGAFLNEGIEYKRSNKSWIREWCAHNWLYDHNIKIERTRDVDLNEDENFLKRFGYFMIYILFCK
jgi:hypothetical protein